jgi:MYXO-CTERM domain-containing protein
VTDTGLKSYGSLTGAFPFAPANNASETGFVGIEFDISGEIHYGWLEVLVSRENDRPAGLEVLSAAYETTPGADIQTGAIPEPASVGLGLGLLALGAAGVRRSRMRS